MEKLTYKRMKEQLQPKMLEAQGYRCPMCNADLSKMDTRNICVDHDHETGVIRGVLCRNCNGMSGKVENIAHRSKKELTKVQWLENAVLYFKANLKPRWNYWHPSHKTPTEKLATRNLKARIRRAELKQKGNSL